MIGFHSLRDNDSGHNPIQVYGNGHGSYSVQVYSSDCMLQYFVSDPDCDAQLRFLTSDLSQPIVSQLLYLLPVQFERKGLVLRLIPSLLLNSPPVQPR